MTYQYYTKNIYGKEYYIIVEDGFSKIHYALTGHKTLLDREFQLYQTLGLKFIQVLPTKKA